MKKPALIGIAVIVVCIVIAVIGYLGGSRSATTPVASTSISIGANTATATATVTASASASDPAHLAPAVPTSSWPTSAPGPALPSDSPTALQMTSPPPGPAAPGVIVKAQVKRFVTTLITTTVTRAAWIQRLTPFTTPDLGQRLGLTDPADIPHQRITGDPQLLWSSNTEAVSGWFVPTSTVGYTVTLALAAGHMVITAVTPGRVQPTHVPTDND